MIMLLQWLIFGHVHKYEPVEDLNITIEGRVKSKIYITRCDCGKMKKFEVHS